jgi:hypothetical protein
LGVTLFEIASGVLPFGEMGGILLSSGAGKPELDAGFGYSRQLESIIQSCLSQDPDERPTASELIEKSEFYIRNQFWPIEKTQKDPAWILFMRRLNDLGSGLSGGVGRAVSGAYRLRKPILTTASVLLFFFIVSWNYDSIRKYLAGIKSVPNARPVVQDTVSARVDTAGLVVAPVSTEGLTEGTVQVTDNTIVARETLATGTVAPKTVNSVSASDASTQTPVSKIVTERRTPETIQPPTAEVIPTKPDPTPTVIAQTELKVNPDPVVNIVKPAEKPVKVNTPPVIQFSQNRYTVFNTQNQLLIAGVATDDGSVSSYEWSQGNNPSKVEFKEVNRGNTLITNINKLKAGKYLLTLTVTDNEGLKTTRDVELLVRISRN